MRAEDDSITSEVREEYTAKACEYNSKSSKRYKEYFAWLSEELAPGDRDKYLASKAERSDSTYLQKVRIYAGYLGEVGTAAIQCAANAVTDVVNIYDSLDPKWLDANAFTYWENFILYPKTLSKATDDEIKNSINDPSWKPHWEALKTTLENFAGDDRFVATKRAYYKELGNRINKLLKEAGA